MDTAPAHSNEPVTLPVPALPRDTRFDVTPYVPDGGFSAVGLIVLLLGLAVAGVIMGVVCHYVSKWFYMIVVFPMVIGFVIGGVGSVLVKTGKVRAPWLAGVAGLLAGILAMTTTHYLDYREFVNLIQENKFNVHMGAIFAPKEENALAKKMLKVKSFADYIDFAAEQGVSIRRAAGGNDKGMNLGYYGTYIYWLVETLIVAGIVFTMTRKPAQEPFCQLTNEWKTERCGDNFMVPQELGLDAVAEALKNGELGKIAEVKSLGAANPELSIPTRLYIYASPQHSEQCTLDVRLNKFVPGKNGTVEEKQMVMATYPASALGAFVTLCG